MKLWSSNRAAKDSSSRFPYVCAAMVLAALGVASQIAVVGGAGNPPNRIFWDNPVQIALGSPRTDPIPPDPSTTEELRRKVIAAASYGSSGVMDRQPVADSIALLLRHDYGIEPAQIALFHGLDPQNLSTGSTGKPGFARRLSLGGGPNAETLFRFPTVLASADFNPPKTSAELQNRRSGDLVIGFDNSSTLALVYDFDNGAFETSRGVRDDQTPLPATTIMGSGVARIGFNCSPSGVCDSGIVTALAAQDVDRDNDLDLVIISDGTVPQDRLLATPPPNPPPGRGTYMFVCLQENFPNFTCSSQAEIPPVWSSNNNNGSGDPKSCGDEAYNRGEYSDKVGDCGGGGGPTPRRRFSQRFSVLPSLDPDGGFTAITSAEDTVYIITSRGPYPGSSDVSVKKFKYPLPVVAATATTFDANSSLDLVVQLQPDNPWREIGTPSDRPFADNELYADYDGLGAFHPAYPYLEISLGQLGRAASRAEKVFAPVGVGFVKEFRMAPPLLVGDFVNQINRDVGDRWPEILVQSDGCVDDLTGNSSAVVNGIGGLGNYLSYIDVQPNRLPHCPGLGDTFIVGGEFVPNLESGGHSMRSVAQSTRAYLPDLAVIRTNSYVQSSGVTMPRTVSLLANVNPAR